MPMSTDSVSKKIAELFELHKSGLLSKEEYEVLKSELLNEGVSKAFEEENVQPKNEPQKPQEEVNVKTTVNNDNQQTDVPPSIVNTTAEPIKAGDSQVPSQNHRSKKAIIILIGLVVVVISGVLIGLYIKRNEAQKESLLTKQQMHSDSLKKSDSINKAMESKRIADSLAMVKASQERMVDTSQPIPEEIEQSSGESSNRGSSKTIAEGPLNIISVTASSFMNPSGNMSYSPSNATDHNLQSWWTPSPPHSNGYNSWLKIDFGQNRNVNAIEIHNGSHYPNYPKYGDIYLKNNRLIKAELRFSNGNTIMINLREVDEIQKISIPIQNTTYILLVPLMWTTGSQWNDLCISEFTAIGASDLTERNETNIMRDHRSKDIANVYYNPKFTLFCKLSDEPIYPNSSGKYDIWYSSHEDPQPNHKIFSATELKGLLYYKFKNYENCKKWCDSMKR